MPLFRSSSLIMAAILSSCCWMRSCRGFLGPASSISTSAAIQRLTTPLSRHGPLFSTASKKEAEAPSDVVVAEGLTYSMEDVVGLCKRRGIIFPSSEIYNGYAGFYDYGPLGSELKKNVKDAWWKNFVMMREDVVGVDSSIIHNPETWKSSGTRTLQKTERNVCLLLRATHEFVLSCFTTRGRPRRRLFRPHGGL